MAAAGRPAERAAGRRAAARALAGRPRPPPRRRPRPRRTGSSPSGARTSSPTTCSCSCAARPAAASSTATPRSSACAASTSSWPPATRSRSCEPSRPPPSATASRSRSASATPATDLATAYRQAVACTRLAVARRRRRLHAERLGPLRFLLDAPDVSQVRAVVHEQLGPLLAHEGARRPAGHAAGVRRRRRQRRRDREGVLHPQEHAALPPQAAHRGARPRPRRARREVPPADGVRPRRTVRRDGHRSASDAHGDEKEPQAVVS